MVVRLRQTIVVAAGFLVAGMAIGDAVSASTATAQLTASSPSPSPPPQAAECPPPSRGGGGPDLFALVAKLTGQSPKSIIEALRAGKTLDQIAGSEAAAVRGAAAEDLRRQLDEAVTAGRITKQQEADMLHQFASQVAEIMAKDLSAVVPPAGRPSQPPPVGCRGPDLLGLVVQVTAQQTGQSPQSITEALAAGKTIDQIAGSRAPTIRATVLDILRQQLEQMVQQQLTQLGSVLDTLMGSVLPPGPGEHRAQPSPSASAR